ncbi:MAG: hypothetical protein WC683_12710 [bacterium]
MWQLLTLGKHSRGLRFASSRPLYKEEFEQLEEWRADEFSQNSVCTGCIKAEWCSRPCQLWYMAQRGK